MTKSHNYYSSNQINKAFAPWPIRLPRSHWRLRLYTPAQLRKLKSIWLVPSEKKRRSIGWWAGRIEKNRDSFINGRHHNVMSRIHNRQIPGVIVVWRGIVIDGNHSLCALLIRKFKSPVLVAETVGVR